VRAGEGGLERRHRRCLRKFEDRWKRSRDRFSPREPVWDNADIRFR